MFFATRLVSAMKMFHNDSSRSHLSSGFNMVSTDHLVNQVLQYVATVVYAGIKYAGIISYVHRAATQSSPKTLDKFTEAFLLLPLCGS